MNKHKLKRLIKEAVKSILTEKTFAITGSGKEEINVDNNKIQPSIDAVKDKLDAAIYALENNKSDKRFLSVKDKQYIISIMKSLFSELYDEEKRQPVENPDMTKFHMQYKVFQKDMGIILKKLGQDSQVYKKIRDFDAELSKLADPKFDQESSDYKKINDDLEYHLKEAQYLLKNWKAVSRILGKTALKFDELPEDAQKKLEEKLNSLFEKLKPMKKEKIDRMVNGVNDLLKYKSASVTTLKDLSKFMTEIETLGEELKMPVQEIDRISREAAKTYKNDDKISLNFINFESAVGELASLNVRFDFPLFKSDLNKFIVSAEDSP